MKALDPMVSQMVEILNFSAWFAESITSNLLGRQLETTHSQYLKTVEQVSCIDIWIDATTHMRV